MSKGSGLESTVIASQRGIISVEKFPHAARRIPGGKMVGVRGPVDFGGEVVGVGRGIWFDAKECELKHRFPIGNHTHLPAHQKEFLIRRGRNGSVAGLLVEATSLGRFLWLDWSHIAELAGTASVPWVCERWVDLGETTHAILFERIPGVGFESRPGRRGGRGSDHA